MYVIKIEDGLGLSFGTGTLVDTMSVNLYWENDDGRQELAAQGRQISYDRDKQPNAKTLKWHRKWLFDKGCDLKAEYVAYLKKHKERKEVARQREANAKKAERARLNAISARCREKADEVIAALRSTNPALADYLENGHIDETEGV